MCRCVVTAARTALCGQEQRCVTYARLLYFTLSYMHFSPLPYASMLTRSPSVASDSNGTKTDGMGADSSGPVTQEPTPLQQLQAAISKVEASIEKVDGKIDKAEEALAPGGSGVYLGKRGDALQAYFDRLLVKEQQLRDEKAALLKKEADLLAKCDGAALMATTGECGMSGRSVLPFQRA